jgi:hypothetical protein
VLSQTDVLRGGARVLSLLLKYVRDMSQTHVLRDLIAGLSELQICNGGGGVVASDGYKTAKRAKGEGGHAGKEEGEEHLKGGKGEGGGDAEVGGGLVDATRGEADVKQRRRETWERADAQEGLHVHADGGGQGMSVEKDVEEVREGGLREVVGWEGLSEEEKASAVAEEALKKGEQRARVRELEFARESERMWQGGQGVGDGEDLIQR